ncbi:MAG: DNA translocase FtsK [Lachnospiraceae bacterium]|nr:DNA translocase FtsK [Lachnospiraceae bacterium]
MATSKAGRNSNGARAGRNTARKSSSSSSKSNGGQSDLSREICLILALAASVLLFLCNFGTIGPIGDVISSVQFGILGLPAYVFPILIFIAIVFKMANKANAIATLKLVSGVVLYLLVGIVCDMIWGYQVTGDDQTLFDILPEIYRHSAELKTGGGILSGTLSYLLHHFLARTGTILVLIVLFLICAVIISERSLLRGVRQSGEYLYEKSKEESQKRRERAEIRREEEERLRKEEELRLEQDEQEKILRMDKKVSGVMADTTIELKPESARRDDIHEITVDDDLLDEVEHVRLHAKEAEEPDVHLYQEEPASLPEEEILDDVPKPVATSRKMPKPIEAEPVPEQSKETFESRKPVRRAGKPAVFKLPPIDLLTKSAGGGAKDSADYLKTTAERLTQTLKSFGVDVTVTDISQGPSVTRYEMKPAIGVKVSRIVNLADDIKLSLAATDIRIEAPIPGKQAVGIEVPNKENSTVALRDLLESREFKAATSKISFAVGKDIGGKTIVTDIAKMPHMLIAGATGSGKSVCINTLIMSILYKATPDEVKLIMVDPKVVELSVYNGIPHLLQEVVTDTKKAAATLNWAVAEMTKRYQAFADMEVRDLVGFNKKAAEMAGQENAPSIMPQIVIIVDELADLMMVAAKEVEDSICRLAQLARAAGIHLILATQRPSVDVITGLIKANMPSRIAFAVSSGVDSRTILDMNGAEKLLGKGDMLFYPQSYPKPARIQGAFVSDAEVGKVVAYLKDQAGGNVVYDETISQEIQGMQRVSSDFQDSDGGSEYDDLFAEVGRFIIDSDKASIGSIQRKFRVGFNRAARIMDQLCDAGVVGEEEGTKPRRILMSPEQFEQFIEEYV